MSNLGQVIYHTHGHVLGVEMQLLPVQLTQHLLRVWVDFGLV